MSKGFDLTVQHLRTDAATRTSKVTHVSPYVALIDANHGTLYVRGGNCYDSSGDVVEPIPDWVHEKLSSVNHDKLRILGFKPEVLFDQKSVTKSGSKGIR